MSSGYLDLFILEGSKEKITKRRFIYEIGSTMDTGRFHVELALTNT